MTPKGDTEFQICIIRVSLGILGVLWCIKSYQSVLLWYPRSSLGYPWGSYWRVWNTNESLGVSRVLNLYY